MEQLLFGLWTAHIHSIQTALPLFNRQLSLLSSPEAQFGQSWAGLVDLIAECLFLCNMTTTDVLQHLLPPRILQEEDNVPLQIANITRLQNRAVFLIDTIYTLNVTSQGTLERDWIKMMCTQSGRAIGREMLTLGIYRPELLVEGTVELMKIVKNQSPDEECLISLS